jgi:hypothetical protein
MTLTASPRRASWLVWLTVAMNVAAGCGESGSGGNGGGGGSGAFNAVIPLIQNDFGTSMVSASAEGDTLTITLVNGASAAMAKLFMCANILPRLKTAGLENSKVVIVEQSGTQLATEAVCPR